MGFAALKPRGIKDAIPVFVRPASRADADLMREFHGGTADGGHTKISTGWDSSPRQAKRNYFGGASWAASGCFSWPTRAVACSAESWIWPSTAILKFPEPASVNLAAW